MVAGNCFNGKFTAKIDFPIGYFIGYRVFYITIANADIGSLKSLHTLFDKDWTTCWWNFNKIVWFELY